ncbi:MAG: putative sugar O-methyltransferase [Agriterribacter sp.]
MQTMKEITNLLSHLSKILLSKKEITDLEKDLFANFEFVGRIKKERTAFWEKKERQIVYEFLNKNPKAFLNFKSIKHTMFYNGSVEELQSIQRSKNFHTLYERLLVEDSFGMPLPFAGLKKSSGNLIHHLYSLKVFLENTNIKLDDINQVIEFGGGYGSLCRLFYKASFKYEYLIFDLPIFLTLQEYYLKGIFSNNLKVEGVQIQHNIPVNVDKAVYLTHDNKEFQKLIRQDPNTTVCIALWSLSESPLAVREKFLSSIGEPSFYLIAYQTSFENIDNKKYFEQFVAGRSNYNWLTLDIDHIKNSHYLIGTKK